MASAGAAEQVAWVAGSEFTAVAINFGTLLVLKNSSLGSKFSFFSSWGYLYLFERTPVSRYPYTLSSPRGVCPVFLASLGASGVVLQCGLRRHQKDRHHKRSLRPSRHFICFQRNASKKVTELASLNKASKPLYTDRGPDHLLCLWLAGFAGVSPSLVDFLCRGALRL